MGSIKRRLARLEAGREISPEPHASEVALRSLSCEDIVAMDEAFDEAHEAAGGELTWEALSAASGERARAAFGRWLETMEALERGEEPPEDHRCDERCEAVKRAEIDSLDRKGQHGST
jgi:hypothetical protein